MLSSLTKVIIIRMIKKTEILTLGRKLKKKINKKKYIHNGIENISVQTLTISLFLNIRNKKH